MLRNGNSMIKRISVTVSDDSFESLCAGALEVLKNVQSWPADSVKFELFKDGITNHLLKCYQQHDPDCAILIRVYGKRTELFIDRDLEVENMQAMFEAGQCAPLYCAFQNGLCYGFSPGIVLDTVMVRDPAISRLIAHRLAKMHSIKRHINGIRPQPTLFPMFLKYLKLIPEAFEDPLKQERFLSCIPSKQQLLVEVNTLKAQFDSLNSPIVFSHNDLLLKNIVYNEDKNMLTFIDYEYASYNYQAFDIGNHFCEFAGVDKYEPELYPDQEFQMIWLRHYLEEWYSVNEWSNKEVTDGDIYQLYIQVNKFSLAAHLLWAFWALVQAAHSTLDFDFLGYAEERVKEYFVRKDQFLLLDFNETQTGDQTS